MRPDRAGHEISIALSHRDDAARMARHALLELMVDVEPAVTRDALLAVSELVSNVFLHTEDGCVVRASVRGGDEVRLEVIDTSSVLPAMSVSDDPIRSHGRGLSIVDSVARAWGAEAHHGGKTVWAVVGAA